MVRNKVDVSLANVHVYSPPDIPDTLRSSKPFFGGKAGWLRVLKFYLKHLELFYLVI